MPCTIYQYNIISTFKEVEKGMEIHSSILPGEFHVQKSLAGYSLWGHKELDTTEQLTHIT